MKPLKFRKLRADEVECRISVVKGNKISLLLYKDARCDMNILDEVVGPMNWQRFHSRDNANCTVSIWDDDRKIWVSKEDTGKESYTEKEKGLASDSFKRACFNWGIGRELYTAPFIWIYPDPNQKICEIKPAGNGKYACYDRFEVSELDYDENGRISLLVIKNAKSGMIAYQFSGPEEEKQEDSPKQPKPQEQTADRLINKKEQQHLLAEAKRTGMNLEKALRQKNISNIGSIQFSVYEKWIDQLKQRQSLPEPAPEDMTQDIPESVDSELPWN